MTRAGWADPVRVAVLVGVAIVWPAGVALVRGQAPAPARAQAPAPAPARAPAPVQTKQAADPREADRAAIGGVLQSFTRAFQGRDAKALAAHWTVGGEYRNDAGDVRRGREALEAGFAALFAATPELQAALRTDAVHFLSADAATAEGSVEIRRGPAASASRARYSALLVREGGRWLLAQLSESPDDRVSVEDLAWLIGTWRSTAGQDAEIQTTYAWSPGKKFIQARFTLREKQLELTGTQVIGVDPATGVLHTWTFEADGGVGEADWSRDGDHWVLDAAGTLIGGATLDETNVLRRVDDDTFTWQSIGRTLDGAPLPDLRPIKVTRVAPSK
jgi:uncharacterized protein (TIGR02246 family)